MADWFSLMQLPMNFCCFIHNLDTQNIQKHQNNPEKLFSDTTQCASSPLWLTDSGIVVHTSYLLFRCCHFIVLTSTPDPNMPPKYQTCTVIWSLSTDFPPGKKSRMLHSTHTIDRGIRVIPRHLAKPPEHILTLMLQPPLPLTTRCRFLWASKLYLSWCFKLL